MGAFEELPPAVAANPHAYALLLAVATDGQPSNDTHPPAGPTGYGEFTKGRAAAVSATHGEAAVPTLVAIGLGNDLDSRLLKSFSDTFLHIPDPGSVGPFMVNLLAATRSTARVATATPNAVDVTDGAAAPPPAMVVNHGVLILSPASAIASVPGYRASIVGDVVHVPIGALMYAHPPFLPPLVPRGMPSSPHLPWFHMAGTTSLATSSSPTAAAQTPHILPSPRG